MKAMFTFLRSINRMLAIAVFLGAVSPAFAGGDGYYDYYAELNAYPTGAGTVYASTQSSETVPPADGINFFDFTKPAEQVTVKYYAKNISSYSYQGHAIPAKGWIFAGFSGATRDAENAFVFSDNVTVIDNPGDLGITATVKNNDEASALTNFPLTPDTTHYAIFTHVAPRVAVGQDKLGTATISKICNNLNDNVTLTATATNAKTTKFDYWINKTTKQKINDNPLNIQITDTAYYEAHFLCDSAIYLNFPDEGGYQIFYNEYMMDIPTNVSVKNFNYQADYISYNELIKGDSLCYDQSSKNFYDEPTATGYQIYGSQPYIIYGKGECTLVKQDKKTAEENTRSLLRWSGESGLNTTTLGVTNHGYSIDLDKQVFNLLPDNSEIPANTAFLVLPNERYKVFGVADAPKVIYWSLAAANPTGITNLNSEKEVAKKGIYTIDGKKLNSISHNGLYIIDGKKVLQISK